MILSGDQIPLAASRTQHPVILRDDKGSLVSKLDLALLSEYVSRGYEVHGSKRRIRYLRPPVPKVKRAELPWIECMRTCDSAVMWPFIDSYGPTI